MNEKHELAQYLVNILGIMSSREDAGRSRGPTLGAEYEKNYARLREIIDKEHEDEARKSEQQRERSETGTDLEGGEPRRG